MCGPINPSSVLEHIMSWALRSRECSQSLLRSRLVLTGLDDFELAVADVVDDSMELQATALHGVDNCGVHAQDLQATENIVLRQTQTSAILVHLLQLFGVFHS